MSESKKAFYGVDASKIEIKKLLNKEFLELSLKAISDEKPNRNDTWFTLESIKNSKDTVYNKPVLGFFKNNDFVSHNGKWSKDEELDMEYWDTLGDGERCIGLIRESDDVEIVQDEKGLNWLTFSCALWTQYSYKQVKRLLKDALKAQKEGGPTKNISVEVNLTDYEDIYDPESGKTITKINSFELVGVTILGSRNGVKVEPGIEGAELSVVDIMDTALYENKMKSLRLAYEKLGDTKTNIIKEDESMPGIDEQNVVNQTNDNNVQTNNTVDNANPEVTDQTNVQNFESSAATPATEPTADPVPTTEPTSTDPVPTDEPAPTADPQPVEPTTQNFEADPVYDLPWFISKVHDLEKDFGCTLQYYKDCGVKGAEYILAVMEKQAKIYANCCKELADVLAKVCAEDYEDNPDEIAYENNMCDNCDCNELYSKFEAKSKEYDELNAAFATLKEESDNKIKDFESKIESYADYETLKEKVKVFELNTLIDEAKNYVTTAELPEEKANQIYEDCKNGKYTSADEVKTAVAVLAFEAKSQQTKVKTVYQAPVNSTPVVETSGDPETPKAKSGWDVLKDYNSNK